ncbi:MAG TPA: DUF4157 domain-containing protein [Kofleriaceae bacterium]|jgi:hypothetical protein|nr:DUF4157 domain-containing protein [Kofleriaceae bacterium]
MTPAMRPPDLDRRRELDRFDPAVAGARHGLSREVSLEIWERVSAETADGAGRRDDDLARRRFRELAEHVAAHGGRLRPDVGRVTRVAIEIDRSSLAGWGIAPWNPGTLGRETDVTIDTEPTTGIASAPGRRTLVGDGAAASRLGFDDYRVLGLQDLLQRLGPGHVLRPEVVAAAAGTDRSIAGRATRWCERLPAGSAATPDGHVLWQVAERHSATLYRRTENSGLVDPRDPAVDSALQQRGAGEVLPRELRRTMERELGVVLAGVRIHADTMAARAARALAADAFTVGEDIFFAEGKFSPDTRAGQKLLAHELTHVAQAVRGRVSPAGDGPQVSRPGEPLEQEAEAIAAQLDAAATPQAPPTQQVSNRELDDEGSSPALLRAPARLSSDSRVLRSPAGAEQMAQARPAVQSDFVLHASNDDFVVSFELLPKIGAGGAVRVVVSPTDFSRARQSLMKYWDVRGREVKKDDSWTTMGNVGTDAVPWVLQVPIADQTRFDPVVLKELPEKTATVWTFDWNGDTRPEFAIRVDYSISNTQREYNFTAGPNGAAYKFDFSFIQDDAWKYGYQGVSAPRREQGDFVDFLGDILTSKTTWEMAITMIPVIGEVVLLGEAISGYTIFGDKMSTAERVLSGLAALLPVAGGVLAKGATRAGADLAKIAAEIGRGEEEVAALLRAAEKQSAEAATVEKWRSTLKAGGKLTTEDVTRLQRMVRQLEADQRVYRAAEEEMGASRILRKGGKLEQTGPVSLKRLRTTLGRSGVSPSGYHLRKATKVDLDALRAAGTDPSNVYAWVSRDGSNVLAMDARGRPVITFTDKGLSSLEEAVKSFGHEAKHIKGNRSGARKPGSSRSVVSS